MNDSYLEELGFDINEKEDSIKSPSRMIRGKGLAIFKEINNNMMTASVPVRKYSIIRQVKEEEIQ